MIGQRRPTLAQYRDLWLSRVMRHLPVAWVSAIGGHLGALRARSGIAADRAWIRRLRRNIELFRGITEPDEQDRRVVEYTRRLGRIYAEFAVLQRMVALRRVEVIGREHLEGLSRPAILAACHLGNWELAGHVMGLLEGAGCALYAPQENSVYARLAADARLAWQPLTTLVPASPRAMRQLTRAIAGGSNLLMYVDEERDGYIWAPSLGRDLPQAGNRWLTARLAVRHRLDIVPVHVETCGPARYRIIIAPRFTPGEGDADTRVRALADQMDRCFDALIRADPEHWYWLMAFERDKPPPARVPRASIANVAP